MARFQMELPNDIIKDIERLYNDTDAIFGAMTHAGAEVVEANIRANAPEALKESEIMKCLKISKVYKTPSDGGINSKVMFSGYFTNKDGKRTAAPLVANVFEYGRSNSPFPKKPFIRRSFQKAMIEKAMLKAQKKASGGILDDNE